jgi:hypothetical protein
VEIAAEAAQSSIRKLQILAQLNEIAGELVDDLIELERRAAFRRKEIIRDRLEVDAQLEISVADLLPICRVFEKRYAESGGIGNPADIEEVGNVPFYTERIGALRLIVQADLVKVQAQALGRGVALDVRCGAEKVGSR